MFDLCLSCRRNDLGDVVSFQLDGFVGDVGQAERNYVGNPLDLVDDGLGVWKVHAVIHSQRSGLSNHPVKLGLNLFCMSRVDMEHQVTPAAVTIFRRKYFNRWILKRRVLFHLGSQGISPCRGKPSAAWWTWSQSRPQTDPAHKRSGFPLQKYCRPDRYSAHKQTCGYTVTHAINEAAMLQKHLTMRIACVANEGIPVIRCDSPPESLSGSSRCNLWDLTDPSFVCAPSALFSRSL